MSTARSELMREKFKDLLTGRKLAPVHPGVVTFEDFIDFLSGNHRYSCVALSRLPGEL